MGRVTRQQAKIREAEGIPPSPPTELPAELGGTRRRKRVANRARSIITSETDDDASSLSKQNQIVPDQTLREGNAGGYVQNAQGAERTREQQDSFQEADLFLMNFLPPLTVDSSRYHGAEEVAKPPGIIHTTPSSSSSSNTAAIVAPMFSPSTSLSGDGLAPEKVSSSHASGDQATVLASVSTQTDGLAASVASPFIPNTSVPRSQTVVRDVSVQTDHRLGTFRPMSRYGFNGAISVLPAFCDITLHLGVNKEIQISHVTESSIRKIGDILLNESELSYGRNWLTRQEVAAAEARDQASSANKRKRDEETNMPEAQRRRLNNSPTPIPKPAPRSTRRKYFLGKTGNGLGRSLKAMQPALSQGDTSAEADTSPYDSNGELLLSTTNSAYGQDGVPANSDTVANIAANTSATEIVDPRRAVHSPTANAEADLSDRAAATQTHEQTPQTLRPSSWLPKLVASAFHYVPSIRRRHASPATPQTSTVDVRSSDQRVAQTEPRRGMARHSDFGQRLQTSQLAAQKTFRTKGNVEAMKKVKAERERIRSEWERLDEQRKITEEARKITEQEKQDVADAHRAALANQPTGSKRRRPSPRVIPNPKGASYGLDLDFFGDSDSEDEEDTSPSRKSRRISGPDHSPSNARMTNDPLTPNVAAAGSRTPPSGRATEYTGSRFSDSPPNVFGQSTAYSGLVISKDDPRFNHSGHFEVPWSPSSSEGDSSEEEDVATTVVDKSRPVPASATDDTVRQGLTDTVSTSSPEKPVQGPMFPPVTPASRQGATSFENRRDPEAAKTLERNRELLRAKIAGQSRSVLSPKDIQNSPNKTHVPSQASTQQTVQSAAPAIFFQPQQVNRGASDQPLEKPIASHDTAGGFSILGTASRTSPKSAARKLAETLPTVQGRLGGLQSYNDYEQTVDSKVRELLESSWKASDETASGEEFRPAFTDFVASQTQGMAGPGPSQSQDSQRFHDDDAIDEEDHASLYQDDANRDDEGNDNNADDEPSSEEEARLDENEDDKGTTVLSISHPTAFEDFSMDPAVAAFLEDNWAAEDEAYASDEFKTQLANAA